MKGVATISAATDLFGAGSNQVAQLANTWTAVGVLPPPNYTVIDTRTGLASTTNLTFQYATNGATAMKFVTSGGTGDADLYVKFGSAPTTTSYDCRPFTASNNETCEFNPAQSGTYYVMINAYAAYTGLTLTVSAAGAGTPTTETSCTDGVDNDGDGQIDCADSDCATNPACQVPTTETSCTDGIDNDHDGQIDCADSDCATNPACRPTTETSCTDGVDNDGDGKVDCADSDCATNPVCQVYTVISNTNFESGWGPYTDGGGDAARVNNASFASSGTFSIQLRDNSGTQSAFWTTTPMNLSAYTSLRIQYSAFAVSMDAGEDYFVEVQLNNGTYQTVGNFVVGTGFSNNVRHNKDLTFALPAGSSAVRVRFRVDASANDDNVYFDDVIISAK